MRTISGRLEKLEKILAFLVAKEDERGAASLRARLRGLAKRVGEPVVARLEKFLEEVGPGRFHTELIRVQLSAHGFVQGPKESLAETCARALGISPLELRVRLVQGKLGLESLRGSNESRTAR